MRIGIIGTGYVGLVTGLCFAELGHKVTFVDIDNKKISGLRKGKIDFFYETLIVDLNFNDKAWVLTSKNGKKFKSKYLICSTNLLLHKRSLKILNINQIPLRKAIPINHNKKID